MRVIKKHKEDYREGTLEIDLMIKKLEQQK
jgi:hypothetical protein